MATVNSVLGPIDTKDLGFTLMHEHILVGFAGVYQDYPELLGDDPLERAVEKLRQTREGGVNTIVDATTTDLGRDINFIAEASRRSGVNIIAVSGWWMEIPRFFQAASVEQLADVFVREIEEGISGTDIRAGVLKAASDYGGVTPQMEIILRAVGRAHLKTGVPVMLHSYSPGQVGWQQLDILKEEGVDPKRVKMDHSNDTTDIEYLINLLEQGCYLGLDRYPGRTVGSRARTNTMKALIDAGYADRLCPSHDSSAIPFLGPDWRQAEEERRQYNPHGFLYIKNAVFAQLREMGVSEEIINGLCVNGPRNFFEGI
jgi:phosphotriesterase-related protein